MDNMVALIQAVADVWLLLPFQLPALPVPWLGIQITDGHIYSAQVVGGYHKVNSDFLQ